MPTTRQPRARAIDLLAVLRISEGDASLRHGCRLLDIRPHAASFLPGAAWIPVADAEPAIGELPSHMLPAPPSELIVLSDQPERARVCAEQLRDRGWAADWLDVALPDEHLKASRTAPALWKPDTFVAEQFTRLRDALPGVRAVDLGCGNGRDLVYLAQQGLDVLGVDRLPEALAMAKQRAGHHHASIELLCADLLRMAPPREAAFDLALCVRFTGLELLGQMDRWLRPGGVLLFHGYGLHPTKPHPKTMRRAIRLSSERACSSFPTPRWEFVEPVALREAARECWIQFAVRRMA